MRLLLTACVIAAPILAAPVIAVAEPPTIEDVRLARTGEGWTVSVTISHPDSGEHYADAFAVETADGERLATRQLSHPHENQPFTRAAGGVQIPEGTKEIHVRASCSQDGWNDGTTTVQMP